MHVKMTLKTQEQKKMKRGKQRKTRKEAGWWLGGSLPHKIREEE